MAASSRPAYSTARHGSAVGRSPRLALTRATLRDLVLGVAQHPLERRRVELARDIASAWMSRELLALEPQVLTRLVEPLVGGRHPREELAHAARYLQGPDDFLEAV